jgi:hypothetical protein
MPGPDADENVPAQRSRVKLLGLAAAVVGLGGGLGALELVGRGKGTGPGAPTAGTPGPVRSGSPAPTARPLVIPAKAQFLAPAPGQKYFGVAAPGAPRVPSVLHGVGVDAGGVAPNLVEYFVNWTQDYDAQKVRSAYAQHAFPVITWEPWAGAALGTTQPGYSLATIVDGRHDPYIRTFAQAVKDHGWPLALRLGHEMNGHWYPWAERNGVNHPGQFAAAWKHVHAVFQEVGADNVIWIWAPNTLRGADPVSLRSLYPGDAYVDWIGMSAYDVTEWTADHLIGPTLTEIRTFTRRPLLITETGAQPGAQKAPWTTDFFAWLARRPDVLGFVWFEYTHAQGGGTDWNFTSSPRSQTAFRAGVRTMRLVEIPDGSSG